MSHPPTSPRESGSAYVVVLIALLLLSIMALTLAMVTRTEALLGNNERNAARTLAAADMGVNVAVAKALVIPDNRPFRMSVADPVGPGAGVLVRQEIAVTPLTPLRVGPCDLCMVNQGSEFFRVDHSVEVEVERLAAAGPGNRVLSRSGVSTMIDFQPWRPTLETFAPPPG